MAIRLLRQTLPVTELTLEAALDIVEYHVRRNRIAQRSHEKTWKRRYKKVKYKLLL